MVNIDAVREANAALIQSEPLVAVVVGATSGIGKNTVRALAAIHSTAGKGLRVYLVGRNESAATKLISECLVDCPSGQFRFVQAQNLSLLKDVDSVCAEITRLEETESSEMEKVRVDLLVMSQAILSFQSRTETKEGLDEIMSLLYYSRMRFIHNLLPLLLRSTLPSAHIISVYAAGLESVLHKNDLSLRQPSNYTFTNSRSHVTYMKTFHFESLAATHPGSLSMFHYFPSLVITEGFNDPHLPAWFRFIWNWFVGPIAKFVAVSQRDNGERVLFMATERFPARSVSDITLQSQNTSIPAATPTVAAPAISTDHVVGSGCYAVNWNDEIIPTTDRKYKDIREQGMQKMAWDHTLKAFEVIETGGVFKE